jgi:hypothetical protein
VDEVRKLTLADSQRMSTKEKKKKKKKKKK